MQQEDVDYRTEHTLRVTNSAGSAEFIVKLDTSRRCECDRNTGAGQLTLIAINHGKVLT